MELTKEYFEQHLDEKVKGLATKEDLKGQTKELKAYAREQTEELVRLINDSFDDEREYLEKKLDVTNRIKALETDMQKIEEAFHIR
jgi:hypothetical protein